MYVYMYREGKARVALLSLEMTRRQPLSSLLKVDLVEIRSRRASSNPLLKVDLVEIRSEALPI